MNSGIPKHSTSARSAYERTVGVLLDFEDDKGLLEVVHPDFIGYGSAQHEFMQTRQDVQKMARMQSEQLKGQGFQFVRKPIEERYYADGNICLILEEFELSLPSIDHHFLLRLSCMLEKKDGKWLVSHFHGSTPDSDIAEEEAFPMEGLQKKNEELEAKIRERTRELEIEAALERTRAQSLQMHHSSELNEVSNVFHEQLLLLGIDSEFSFVWLPGESRDDHLFWTTWTETVNGEAVIHSKSVSYPLDLSDPYNATCIADWESGVSVHEHFVPPKDIVDFFASWEEMLDGASHLKAEFFPEGIYYTEAFMKYGCFGIDIRRPLTDEEKAILHRFAIEFERTYTRFLELQKAEAQAREAQTEAALERVRSRTMGMHKSEELAEVATVLYNELLKLEVSEFSDASIVVFDEPNNQQTVWGARTESEFLEKSIMPLLGDQILQELYDNWHLGEAFFTVKVGGSQLRNHNDFVFPKADRTELEDRVLRNMPDPTYFHCAVFSLGYIELMADRELPEESASLLKRFAKVFEQTYTRFLDLQKAEAQAREAQVEAALERVRSRTMGMHKSEELKEVVKEIFDQFAILDINAEHAGIVVDYEPNKDWHFWVADTQDIPARVTVPYLDLVWDRQFTEAKKEGRDFFTTQLDFDEKNNFYKQLLPHIEGLTTEARDFYLNCPGLAASTVIQKDIGLYIENFSGTPYSADENDILMRFGNVFQQTYTRFLDLQKAEAQAREARIETALEKVRTHTMGMRSSKDLSHVTSILFEEMKNLGGDLFAFGIVLCDNYENVVEQWHSLADKGMISPFQVPVDLDYIHQYRYDQWKSGKDLFSIEIPEDYIQEHFDKMYTLPSFKKAMEEVAAKGYDITTPTWELDYGASFSHGYLLVSSVAPFEESHIFPRFAKVFEQAYTRFLDLQTAEAQAREAQIETALERVRSRTMAMQHSDELAEASYMLDKEVRGLGIKTWGCAFNIYREKDSIEWFGNEAGLLPTYTVPREGIFKEYFDAGQKGESLLVTRNRR